MTSSFLVDTNRGSKYYVTNTDILKNTVIAHTCRILLQIVYNSVAECCDLISLGVSEVLPNTYLMFSHQIDLAAAEQSSLIPSGCLWKC